MESALLHILQHSLGLDGYGQGRQYRNHYVAGAADVSKCRDLVALGCMQEHPPAQLSGGDPIFAVTKVGLEAVTRESPKPPKKTRSQVRYREYLEVADCYEGFGDWLKRNRARARY